MSTNMLKKNDLSFLLLLLLILVIMAGNGNGIFTTAHSQSYPTKTTTTTLEVVPHHNNLVQKRRGITLYEQKETTKHLKIAVPNKADFREFVGWSNDSRNMMVFNGYSIEIFINAVKELPYQINYTFHLYNNANSTTDYDNMIFALANGKYDAVVGDVTIRRKRLEKVDFTQPYLASGLVIVAPVKEDRFSETWAFMRPFTFTMWLTIGPLVLGTGLVVWFLERENNPRFGGHPREQATTTLWFISSTIFFVQREDIKSVLGRVVVIIWLFTVLIIVSSYTANLTSILTVKNLSPTIDGINTLKRISAHIGHQRGSFVKNYLIEELHIAKERLVSLSTIEEYARALRLGPNHPNGVAAIVAELPYVQLLLSKECGFAIAGQEFTRSGFGYAFPKGSEVGRDISVAILSLSESGRLQEIHDNWLSMVQCSSELQSNRLGIESFIGLYIFMATISVGCLLLNLFRLMYQFRIDYESSFPSSTRLEVLKSFFWYIWNRPTTPRSQDVGTTGPQ